MESAFLLSMLAVDLTSDLLWLNDIFGKVQLMTKEFSVERKSSRNAALMIKVVRKQQLCVV